VGHLWKLGGLEEDFSKYKEEDFSKKIFEFLQKNMPYFPVKFAEN
jgi:hypothetical protein